MDERVKFIGRPLGDEKMAPLCREFGISRAKGHKIWNRYNDSATGRRYSAGLIVPPP